MLAELHPALSPPEISECLRLHYEMQRGGFISDIQESPRGWHIDSELSNAPMWNHSALLPDAWNVSDFLREAISYHTQNRKRPTMYLQAEMEGAVTFLSELQSAGFERFDQETWMVHSLGDLEASSARVRFEEMASAKEFENFTRIFNAAYQIQDQKHGAALKRHRSDDNRSVRHFLAREQGSPVGTGTLVSHDEVGWIYNIGTHPSVRKRGFGREMLLHLLELARASGLNRVLLQVESGTGAERLYTRLGFRALFTRIGYRATAWRPVAPEAVAIQSMATLSSLMGGARGDAAREPAVGREVFILPENVGSRFRSDCKEKQLHPQSVVMAAWACLISRYTGEANVDFAALFPGDETGRNRVSLVSFVIDPNFTAATCLAQAEEIYRKRESAGTASFRQTSNLIESAESIVSFKADARFSSAPARLSFPLEITVDLDSFNSVEIEYQKLAFKKDAIRRMGNHLTRLLEGLLFNSAEIVSRLEMLTVAERQQLLVEWNRVPDFPMDLPLVPRTFEIQVEKTPDALAAVFAGSEETLNNPRLSYRQLNRRANRLAHHLQTLGVRSGIFVGVCLNRSLDFLVALFGILKAGGACVPLDPEYPEERLGFMIEDSEAPVIISEGALSARLRGYKGQVIRLDLDAAKVAASSEKNIVSQIRPEDPAYLIYTSGSTGKPKGVIIPHRAIAIHCADVRQEYGLNSRDRVLQFSSFNFDASFEQILPPLLAGACLVVRGKEVWNIKEFAAHLKDQQLTVADLPTAYWHQLAQEWSASPEGVPANALRLVIVGGEAMSAEKLRLWRQTPLTKLRLLNAYGPTESTITAATFEPPVNQPFDPGLKSVPIGRPRADRKVYILDKSGNPSPIGIPGELLIGGETLATGYLHREELTAEKFVADPFSDDPNARLYRTGDLARYLEDGNIEFLGRIDDQVKIRGFRIELGEIETALSQHSEIREAILIARENAAGEKRLVAYLTAHRQKPAVAELRGYLRARLPEYMVPSAFVILETLPLMPNGKVDRRALPAPEAQTQSAQMIKGPNDPLELQLQLAFERVLKQAPIAVDASFFEVGGDSLQALELIVEIERATGKCLPIGALYQSSTVQGLALELQKQNGVINESCLIPLQTRGNRPPLILIHTTPGDILGYGNLVYHLGTDQPCYGFQSLGMIDPAQSHTSIEQMAVHYVAMLRKFQSSGPYYLAGWCYGGVIAVEMARLLLTAREKIGLLALFETVAMPPRLGNFCYYWHRLKCSSRMSARQWSNYAREKLKYLRDTKMASRMRFREVGTDDALSGDEQGASRLARLEQVYNANLAALKRFRSSLYPGIVTLFNAEEKDPALIPDPRYGWVGLAEQIEIHTVPGGHDSMLGEPHVGVLARKLEAALRQAQANNESQ